MKNLFAFSVSAATAALFFVSVSYAQPQMKGGDMTPPFVTACADKSAGADCSYTNMQGTTITDKCIKGTNPRTQAEELTCGKPAMMGPKGGKMGKPGKDTNTAK